MNNVTIPGQNKIQQRHYFILRDASQKTTNVLYI